MSEGTVNIAPGMKPERAVAPMAQLRELVLARLAADEDKDREDKTRWTRYRLAEECVRRGVLKNGDPVYRWLRGERDIMLETGEVICDILGIPLGAPKRKQRKKRA